MQKKKSRILNTLFTGVIGIVLGVIINRTIDFPYFVIDKNINVIHLLSILTPIAVAIYINIIISKNNEQNSQSKKIFIDKLNEIENLIESFAEFIEVNSFDFYKFLSRKKQIIRSLKLIKDHGILTEQEHIKYTTVLQEIDERVTTVRIDVVIIDAKIKVNNAILSSITNDLDQLRSEIFVKKLHVIQELLSESNDNKK